MTNTLKSMGLPNVPCTGLSKPFLVSTTKIDCKINIKDRWQRLTSRSTAVPRQMLITGLTKIDKKINAEIVLHYTCHCWINKWYLIAHTHNLSIYLSIYLFFFQIIDTNTYNDIFLCIIQGYFCIFKLDNGFLSLTMTHKYYDIISPQVLGLCTIYKVNKTQSISSISQVFINSLGLQSHDALQIVLLYESHCPLQQRVQRFSHLIKRLDIHYCH